MDIVEKVARAIAEQRNREERALNLPPVESTIGVQPLDHRAARAAIAAHESALKESGFVIVPREPTADMGQAGYAAWDKFGEAAIMGPTELLAIWQAMVGAAPGKKPPHA